MPVILAQKESRLEPPSGCGAFNPGLPGLALLYEARPLALSPPAGAFPSLRVHAGVLAMERSYRAARQSGMNVILKQYPVIWDINTV